VTTSRLQGRRGDGSATVRGWVAIYTLGLPAALRDRRRGEIAGDLADETIDAVRRGETAGLRRRRVMRLLLGIPDDLIWRLFEAPATARRLAGSSDAEAWAPPTRVSLVLLGISAIGAAGALTLTLSGVTSGRPTAEVWLGWGPYGFMVACSLILAAVILAVPWPRRALEVGIVASILGLAAAPWLWGCWFLVLIALLVRWYQSTHAGEWRP
jgi:hypothetical protein